MNKVCIFCGKRGNSEEHVWPSWLLKHTKQWPARMKMQAARLNKRGSVDRWERSEPTLTVGNVCQRCNNGWMSELEEKAKPILTPMIQGSPKTLDVVQQTTIVTWLTKTDMILDSMDSGDVFYDRADRTTFYQHRNAPEYLASWLGHYAGPHLRLFTNHRTLQNMRSLPPHRSHISTFAFGHLVLQLLCIKVLTGETSDYLSVRSSSQWDQATVELLQIANNKWQSVQWPPSLSFDDAHRTIDAFSDRFGGERSSMFHSP